MLMIGVNVVLIRRVFRFTVCCNRPDPFSIDLALIFFLIDTIFEGFLLIFICGFFCRILQPINHLT